MQQCALKVWSYYSIYVKASLRNWLVDKPERAPNKGNEIYVPALCKHCGHHQVIRAYTLGNQYGPKCTQCGGKGWFDEPRYSRSKVKKNL